MEKVSEEKGQWKRQPVKDGVCESDYRQHTRTPLCCIKFLSSLITP